MFTKLRATVGLLVEKLNKYQNIRAQRFVGQAKKSNKDPGLSQRQQIDLLQEFKNNSFNVLVSTNVAEEGLDIEECDAVVFYDNVGSEIRFIQRRGRTALTKEGEVIILYCIGTSDEKLLHISMRRMKNMNDILTEKENRNDNVKETHLNLFNFDKTPKIEKSEPTDHTQIEEFHLESQDNTNRDKNLHLSEKITIAAEKITAKPSNPSINSVEKANCELITRGLKVIVSKNIPMNYGVRTLIESIGLDSMYWDDSESVI